MLKGGIQLPGPSASTDRSEVIMTNRTPISHGQSFVEKHILSRLSNRSRRLIFLASLFQEFAAGKCDATAISDLNTTLTLASNPEALRLPALWHGLLWGGKRDILKELCATAPDEEAARVSAVRKLLATTPVWLIYANENDMLRDISRLLHLVGKYV